jgi:hypothetical protein
MFEFYYDWCDEFDNLRRWVVTAEHDRQLSENRPIINIDLATEAGIRVSDRLFREHLQDMIDEAWRYCRRNK